MLGCVREQYKIELRFRNHTVLSRDTLIEEVARCLPEGHTVDLDNPEIFILIEVFKVTIIFPHWKRVLTNACRTECVWDEHREGLL
jgi:hypothetical protein